MDELSLQDTSNDKYYQYLLYKLIMNNKILLFLALWTFFTSLMLCVFFLSIISKYSIELTMNEDFKLGNAKDYFTEKLKDINKDIEEKNLKTLLDIKEANCDLEVIVKWWL